VFFLFDFRLFDRVLFLLSDRVWHTGGICFRFLTSWVWLSFHSLRRVHTGGHCQKANHEAGDDGRLDRVVNASVVLRLCAEQRELDGPGDESQQRDALAEKEVERIFSKVVRYERADSAVGEVGQLERLVLFGVFELDGWDQEVEQNSASQEGESFLYCFLDQEVAAKCHAKVAYQGTT